MNVAQLGGGNAPDGGGVFVDLGFEDRETFPRGVSPFGYKFARSFAEFSQSLMSLSRINLSGAAHVCGTVTRQTLVKQARLSSVALRSRNPANPAANTVSLRLQA